MDTYETDLLYQSEQLAPTPELARTLALVAPEIVVVGDCLPGAPGVPGGAAGIAVSLAALGATVELLSVCGNDLLGALLRKQLIERGVGTSGLLAEAGRHTAPDGARPIRASTAHAVLGALADKARHADCVLIADHGHGVTTDRVREQVRARRPGLAALVVDATNPLPWVPARPDLMTLTRTGTATSLGIPDGVRHLLALDDGGTVLVTAGQPPYRTWASPPGSRRGRSATETAVATLALGMIAELPPVTSAELAQTAADVTAGLPDTRVCTTELLAARLAGTGSAALSWRELERLVRRHQHAGRRVVITSGSFDLLHAAELEALNGARRQGDVLVVAVHSDAVTRRPLQRAVDRVTAVAALSCVDHVVLTDDEVPVELLNRLCPARYVRL